MKRLITSTLGAAIVLGAVVVTGTKVHAQIQFGPNGQVGIPNAFGTYTWIHPDRLNPLANIPVTPPQSVPGVLGQTWLGADGKVHGNTIDPNTGDFYAFNAKVPGNGGSFLVEDDPGQPPVSGQSSGGNVTFNRGNGNHRPAWGGGSRRAPHPPAWGGGFRRAPRPPAWRGPQRPARRLIGPPLDVPPRFPRR